MKKIFTLLIVAIIALSADAQVVFTKWKQKTSYWTSFYTLEAQYMSTDKTIKYLKYYYYAVNTVGDVVMSQTKVIDPTPVGTYSRGVICTGPFEKGKKHKGYLEPAFITPDKVLLIPHKLEIQYMDGSEDAEIEITKDNYIQYFPTLKWRDYKEPEAK